jgi:hypothetical protein
MLTSATWKLTRNQWYVAEFARIGWPGSALPLLAFLVNYAHDKAYASSGVKGLELGYFFGFAARLSVYELVHPVFDAVSDIFCNDGRSCGSGG